jgi:hypothetical protein
MAEHAESQTENVVLRCIECRRAWIDDSERWRVFLTTEEPREPVAYCPDCAEREFG